MSRQVEPSQSRTPEDLDEEVRQIVARKSRRDFLIGGAAALAAIGGYGWLYNTRQIEGLQWPLRRAEEWNAALSRRLFREQAASPTYPLARATVLRVNGDIGIDSGLVLSSWRLRVVGVDHPERYKQFSDDVDAWEYKSSADADTSDALDSGAGEDNVKISAGTPTPVNGSQSEEQIPKTPGLRLTMIDLHQLPYVEMVTQFKCIEGWSQIVAWGGVRFSDFMKAFPPQRGPDGALPKYVAMETPDGDFFTGYDIGSLMNPQSLLCFTMGGRPLTPEHGAPLRLSMPLKYGYKQIKQIARITYTNHRPEDYWAQQGYDWYGGL